MTQPSLLGRITRAVPPTAFCLLPSELPLLRRADHDRGRADGFHVALDLFHNDALQHVADLEVVEAARRDAALLSGHHLLHVLLDVLERVDHAFVDLAVAAPYAQLRTGDQL